MQKLFLLSVIFLAGNVFSQNTEIPEISLKDTSWKASGFFGINASQTAMSNWQGGGQDNVAMNTIFNAELIYSKEKVIWQNKLDAQYGIVKPGEAKIFKKNIDQLFALSKLNINAFAKHFYWTTQADFRTQFSPGYNYNGDSIIGNATSDITSPAYIQLALGLDYKPVPYFSIFLAPIAGKITTVNRQYLADAGSFGVDAAVLDSSGNMVSKGKKIRLEFGGRLVIKFKKELTKTVTLDSYLDLFSNYLHNPGNIDVVFNNLLTIKIGKFFSANVITQMLYDDDIIIKRDWNKDGKYDNKNDINGPRLQVLSTFALGLGYKF